MYYDTYDTRYWIDLGWISTHYLAPNMVSQDPCMDTPSPGVQDQAMDRRAKVQYLDPAVQAQHQTTHDVMAPRQAKWEMLPPDRFPEAMIPL